MKEKRNKLQDLIKLIKYPLLTEKSANGYKKNQYTFIVDCTLNKNDIRYIIEELYSVQVRKINTLLLPTKNKRVGKNIGKTTFYKKVYIYLKADNIISDLIF